MRAIAEAVLAVLQNDGFQKLTVLQGQTQSFSFTVGGGQQFISVVTGWPGSDVVATLVAPSGRRFTRQFGDHLRNTGPHSRCSSLRTWTPPRSRRRCVPARVRLRPAKAQSRTSTETADST